VTSLRFRYAEDTIANFIAAVMKYGGGRASELIRWWQPDSCGLRRIRLPMAMMRQ